MRRAGTAGRNMFPTTGARVAEPAFQIGQPLRFGGADSQTRRTIASVMAERGQPSWSVSRSFVVDALDAAEAAPSSVGDVDERLGIDPSRASRMVAESIAAGDIVRTAVQSDGGRGALELTAQGRRMLAQMRTGRRQIFAERMHDWSAGERRTFARLLTRFTTGGAESLRVREPSPSERICAVQRENPVSPSRENKPKSAQTSHLSLAERRTLAHTRSPWSSPRLDDAGIVAASLQNGDAPPRDGRIALNGATPELCLSLRTDGCSKQAPDCGCEWVRAMNKPMSIMVVAAAVLLTSVMSSCQSGPDATTDRVIKVSWAEWFTAMDELRASADMGVLATVVSVQEQLPLPSAPPYRLVGVDVSRTIWTHEPDASVPAQITFEQTGGLHDGVRYQAERDSLITVGDVYILFFEEYDVGKYRVSGGPTGRFLVDAAGRVHPVVGDGVEIPEPTTVDEFSQL